MVINLELVIVEQLKRITNNIYSSLRCPASGLQTKA